MAQFCTDYALLVVLLCSFGSAFVGGTVVWAYYGIHYRSAISMARHFEKGLRS